MRENACLNCGAGLISKFCHECGQSSHTGRITLKHFFVHDLLHGLWHVDKGLLYTFLQVFFKPGIVAANYLAGRRKRYYNFFYLILLCVGINYLLSNLLDSWLGLQPSETLAPTDDNRINLKQSFAGNYKWLILSALPLFAFTSLAIFRRIKLNIAEHTIVSAVMVLSGSAWAMLYNLWYYLTIRIEWDYITLPLVAFACWILLVPILVFWQMNRHLYTVAGFSWRVLCWYLINLLYMLILVLILNTLLGKTEILLF